MVSLGWRRDTCFWNRKEKGKVVWGTDRVLSVRYWEGCGQNGLAVQSIYKFSPPQIKTNCYCGEGGLSCSHEKCGKAGHRNHWAVAGSQ